jgi:nucleotide-binding universal stress UspA family protein
MFGSLGSDLIHRTAASFLVVGPRAVVTPGWRPSHLLVCTDGSDTSRAIVPIVADWQAAFSPSVKMLQVIAPEAASAARASEGDADEANLVRILAEELGDDTAVDWDVLHGTDPARAILDEVNSTPDTVVAMATHGRSGLAHVTLGSVTDAVIRHSACPVLTVRPEHLREA